jgi:peroxiredoxin
MILDSLKGDPMVRSWFLFSCSSVVMLLVIAMSCSGQDSDASSQDPMIELPQNPGAWINGSPISLTALRGKSVVLYFFEEGCPRCRAKWPAVLAAAKENSSKPVLLIAVNSGTAPDKLARYVKESGIDVPVIIDLDRSLERAAGVDPVSLNNIWQARVIEPDGTLRRGDGGDIPGTLESAAAQATWNVDPTGLPPELISTWRLVEFGNFSAAAKAVTRFARDRKPNVKAGGETLQNYVNKKIADAVALAEHASASGDN